MKQGFSNIKILYLGFNHMLKHKRGVENVIEFQSKANLSKINYYIHWDDQTSVYKYGDFLCIGINNNWWGFFVLNWFIFKIKRKNPSVFIHSHNPLMSIACVYTTQLLTVHDALYYQNKVVRHPLKKLFFVIEKMLYKRVCFVHFVSQYSKKMSLYTGIKNYIVIYNTSYLEEHLAKHKFKKIYGLQECNSNIKLFVVRSMEERSRIDLMISLASHLKEQDFEIAIAGKGPLLDFYKNKINQLKLTNIRLLGYISDLEIINYYNECDLVLVPAEYAEGFGLPIIEAYLCNKPVIASNKCAIPEVIISKDFLFENTLDDILDKIELAQQKKNEDYRTHYNQHFSNKKILEQFGDLYKQLMP